MYYIYIIIYIYIYIHVYIHIVYARQYLTRGNIETIREYLETRETRSDKSISSNSLCDLASIILRMGS